MIKTAPIALVALFFAGCMTDEKPSTKGDPAKAAPAAAPAPAAEQVPPAVQLVREADAAFQAGDLPQAIGKAEAALKHEPNHAVALNIVGRAAAAKYATCKEEADAQLASESFAKAYAANPSFW